MLLEWMADKHLIIVSPSTSPKPFGLSDAAIERASSSKSKLDDQVAATMSLVPELLILSKIGQTSSTVRSLRVTTGNL